MTTTQKIAILGIASAFYTATFAQQPVQVGSGSYAAYTPLIKSATDQHKGDKSRIMEMREIYVSEHKKGEPMPTNDWWTNLLVDTYSGNLWTYPQVVKAEGYGIFIAAPNHWSDDGCEMKWDTKLTIKGKHFRPANAIADDWSDWGLRMQLADGEKQMNVTMAQGVPFTWIETSNLDLLVDISGGTIVSDGNQVELPYETNRLTVKIGNDVYGIYAPGGTLFRETADGIAVEFAEDKPHYLSVAVLPDETAAETFAQYAPVVPRQTEVAWQYNEKSGEMTSIWNITSENLDGGSERNILQGFLPHHYKNSVTDISFLDYSYQTPRGKMKLASGTRFSTTYSFSGILPWFAAPKAAEGLENPYDRERMVEMIRNYANEGNFGADTYWGGKGLTQMALYMTFAKEMGEQELFEQCRSRLRAAMENWLTYTPGETSYFFARYDRWRALVGYDTSYDSDTFNDHHFHYGYFTYAGALLALADDNFRAKYGDMLRLIAKDYANWDRNDKTFPWFRTFSPWSGHSYAGGLGNTGNGNGQESTSEAMQGWGGMYLLGIALGDKEMRDAGIFGWVTESKGVAEYWFDRDRENINRDLYTKPYNSNLTAAGIGWWTWFSGDPVWIHSIQWMPISPCLDYLSEDLEFAKWDYEQMWAGKEIGGWIANPDYEGSALSKEPGLGNVVLSYLQRFDPDQAAKVFDEMWNAGTLVAKSTDTNGITYYITHSHRTYGDRDFTLNADIPTASAYKDKNGDYTYMAYNADATERTVTFYRDGNTVKAFKAPAKQLTVFNEAPKIAAVKIDCSNRTIEPGSSIALSASVLDQYGATVDAEVTWNVEGSAGTITNDGIFTAGNEKTDKCIITAHCGEFSDEWSVRIDDAPALASAAIEPALAYELAGKTVTFSFQAQDQYGDPFPINHSWSIEKDGKTVKTDSVLDLQSIGVYTVKVNTETGNVYSHDIYMTPPMENLALHKPVTASSQENAGTPASYATDGDMGTRWGSQHTDDEWIYVDLERPAYINSLRICWEAAYANRYEVLISDDGTAWTSVSDITGNGGNETVAIGNTARYVKLLCKSRATSYGYSLYEIEVLGINPDSNPETLMGIEIISPETLLIEGHPVELSAKGYNGKGEQLPVSPKWDVAESDGSITEEGVFIPKGYGIKQVTATAEGKSATIEFVVEESVKPQSATISPSSVELVKGQSIAFETIVLDQFSTICQPDGFSYVCEEAPDMLNGNVFTALQNGTYEVTVTNGTVTATAIVKVGEFEEVNLALGKAVYASSFENDETRPEHVNDGNLSTRWGSAFEDNQSIVIDLGDAYVLNRTLLYWNSGAYATDYRIEVSLDEDNWTTVYETQESTGGIRDHRFNSAAGRFVRIFCMKRSNGYGSCLDEVEIYGTALYENPQPAAISMDGENGMAAYIGEPLTMHAWLTDQYGLDCTNNFTIDWNTDNDCAEIDETGTLTPLREGECIVTASYGSLAAHKTIRVLPARIVSGLAIEPIYAEIEPGTSIQLEAFAIDQYGNRTKTVCEWENGETAFSDGLFFAEIPKEYTITATCNGQTASAKVRVIATLSENIALNKPVDASAGTGNMNAANDGNDGSRWIGDETDKEKPVWLVIDLQRYYHLLRSSILWERASAADYEIQCSANGEQWQTLHSETGLADANGNRRDDARLDAICRYIRLWCTKRATLWDYSIYEWALYGREMEAGEPCAISISGENAVAIDSHIQFFAEVRDCNGTLLPNEETAWTASGGGIINADGNFHAKTQGDFFISATSKLASTTAPVNVFSASLGMVDSPFAETRIWSDRNTLHINTPATINRITVYDIAGTTVLASTEKIEGHWQRTLQLPAGVYVVYVETATGTIHSKVLF